MQTVRCTNELRDPARTIRCRETIQKRFAVARRDSPLMGTTPAEPYPFTRMRCLSGIRMRCLSGRTPCLSRSLTALWFLDAAFVDQSGPAARSGPAAAAVGLLQCEGGLGGGWCGSLEGRRPSPPSLQPQTRALDVHVVNRRDVERQQLRDEQAADDRQAQRTSRFGAGAQAPARSAACRRARPWSSS